MSPCGTRLSAGALGAPARDGRAGRAGGQVTIVAVAQSVFSYTPLFFLEIAQFNVGEVDVQARAFPAPRPRRGVPTSRGRAAAHGI
mgnify:CR=1 FL=1